MVFCFYIIEQKVAFVIVDEPKTIEQHIYRFK